MPHPNNKSLPEKVKPWLTLLSSFGITGGAAFAVIAGLWQSAKGELVVSERLLLVLAVLLVAFLGLGGWWIWKKRAFLLSLKRPRHFQDDYSFDPILGVSRHRFKPGFYCPKCVLKEIQSPLQDYPKIWQCLAEDSHFYEKPCPF